jgi:hypothetical protein
MKLTAPYSFVAYIVVVLLVFLSVFGLDIWYQKNTHRAFEYDAMGYYIYLPAIFIYDDITHFRFLDEIIPKYQIWGCAYKPEVLPATGNALDKYAIGQALYQAPWFFLAHAIAAPLGYPADGFSFPYHAVISLGNILVSLLSLWYLRRILLRYFPDKAVAFSLLLLLIATNYWCYISYNSHMTHTSLFCLFVLLLAHTIKWHEKPNWTSSLFIGGVVGFATIMRPTDIVCVLIPLLWNIEQRALAAGSKTSKWQQLKAACSIFVVHYPKLIAAAAIGACFIFLQLCYWKIATDQWVFYSYGGQYLELTKAHIAQVLYGYRKGWLVYTPIMLLALIGFVPLYRQCRVSFWAILVFFLLNFYLVASWSVWWYGGSYGQRALIQSYAFLLFPFTAFFTWALQARFWVWIMLLPSLALFVWLNVTQTFCGIMESDGHTRTYFWHVFGKTSITRYDRKYLHIDEKFTKKDFKSELLYETHFANDTLFEASNMLVPNPMGSDSMACATNPNAPLCSPVLVMDTLHRHTPIINIALQPQQRQGWLRVSFNSGYKDKEWNFWDHHIVEVNFLHNGEKRKAVQLRPADLFEYEWTPISFDTEIPAQKDITDIAVFIWATQSRHALYFDDLKVERLY